jgi:purine-binding chemotaxis protein CheW
MIRRGKERRASRGDVDWKGIRQRLARAAAATEGTLQLTPEQAARVLEERAKLLARPTEEKARAGEDLHVVVMLVGAERYAIEARWVRHAMRAPERTLVPGAAPPFAGLVSVRGEILPVFDARHLLGAKGEPTEAERVIVLGESAPEVGLLVDEASEVDEVPEIAFAAPPASLSDAARALVRGVTADGLVLLAGDVLLADRRLFVTATNDA